MRCFWLFSITEYFSLKRVYTAETIGLLPVSPHAEWALLLRHQELEQVQTLEMADLKN